MGVCVVVVIAGMRMGGNRDQGCGESEVQDKGRVMPWEGGEVGSICGDTREDGEVECKCEKAGAMKGEDMTAFETESQPRSGPVGMIGLRSRVWI